MPGPEEFVRFQKLNQKRLRILDLLSLKGELTKESKVKVLTTNDLSSLEEFYDSYSSNNQTRELIAIKKYLEPLAAILWRQEKNVVPQDDALAFIDSGLNINSRDDALAGARDIMAEWIRNNKEAKKELKALLKSHGSLNIEIIKEDHPELIHYKQCLSSPTLPLNVKTDHISEILEAESNGIVSLSIGVPKETYVPILEKFFIKRNCPASQQVRIALEDSCQRFLLPYIEVEARTQLLEDTFQEALSPKKDQKYLFLVPLILLGLLLALKSAPHHKPEGIVKEFYPNGQIKSIESYLNGKRDGGFRKFLPNGQIVLFVTYKNDVLDGESREYYDNGQWKTVKDYKEGMLEGFVQEYDSQGHLQHQIYYHNNIPILRQIDE
jgi:hypothetical protein